MNSWKIVVLAGAVALAAGAAGAAGETPSDPLTFELGQTMSGETSRAVFYRFVPNRSGLARVTLVPENADLDLAVMGPAGNPTVESRLGGLEREEVVLPVTAGTPYIVRVTSASGRYGRYQLEATLEGGASERATTRPSTRPDAPDEMLPVLPLGRFVPDESETTKKYRLRVPPGFQVAVVVRPVLGGVSLQVKRSDETASAVSRRPGPLPEEVELPAGPGGVYTVEVHPDDDATVRYFIGAQLRLPGSAVVPRFPVGPGYSYLLYFPPDAYGAGWGDLPRAPWGGTPSEWGWSAGYPFDFPPLVMPGFGGAYPGWSWSGAYPVWGGVWGPWGDPAAATYGWGVGTYPGWWNPWGPYGYGN